MSFTAESVMIFFSQFAYFYNRFKYIYIANLLVFQYPIYLTKSYLKCLFLVDGVSEKEVHPAEQYDNNNDCDPQSLLFLRLILYLQLDGDSLLFFLPFAFLLNPLPFLLFPQTHLFFLLLFLAHHPLLLSPFLQFNLIDSILLECCLDVFDVLAFFVLHRCIHSEIYPYCFQLVSNSLVIFQTCLMQCSISLFVLRVEVELFLDWGEGLIFL